MTARLFVDTNVLIYSLDPSEPAKRARASALIAQLAAADVLVTNPQILNECYRVLTQRRKLMAVDEARGFLLTLAPTCTAPLDRETTIRAWEIEDRTRYSWWDCLLIASAIQAGCDTFVTEDLEDGRRIDTVQLVDPFVNDISAISRNF